MNNLNQLRLCKLKSETELFYFHKWVEKGETKCHGEDPQKDICFVSTYALVEGVNTGKVYNADTTYGNIIFIK